MYVIYIKGTEIQKGIGSDRVHQNKTTQYMFRIYEIIISKHFIILTNPLFTHHSQIYFVSPPLLCIKHCVL